MVPAILLTLREGIEVTLVLGIVLGVLRRLEREDFKPAVWRGVLAGLVISVLVAFIMNAIGVGFSGPGEQIFEGSTMLIAAALLTWMIFWMRSHGSQMKRSLENRISQSISQNDHRALFLLSFLAVVRDGIELAIFLFASRLSSNWAQTITGALIGLLITIILGRIFFATTSQINLAHFFPLTNIFLVVFAAGLVAQGIKEMNEVGLIPSVIDPLWRISHVIASGSPIGQLLTSLFGYNDSPSLTEVAGYSLYLVTLGLVFRFWKNKPKRIQDHTSQL